MQRLQNNMDNLLYRTEPGDYDKARQYMQLQNRFLTYKHQLNSIPDATMLTQFQERTQMTTNVLSNPLLAVLTPTLEPSTSVLAPNGQPPLPHVPPFRFSDFE